MPSKEITKAVAYFRTSSSTNVGADKDSEKRQRAAVTQFAKANGYDLVDSYYDAAVSGADPIDERKGFAAMLERIASRATGCASSSSRPPRGSPAT
jgi:DNA invertase Pin-like site-specific DNA recombinase